MIEIQVGVTKFVTRASMSLRSKTCTILSRASTHNNMRSRSNYINNLEGSFIALFIHISFTNEKL